MKALDERDEGQGACVLRPSNQGDSLTLTWCHIGANPAEGGYPAKAMYYHIKVREVERADVPGGLGFEVDGEAFEDLDEIAARFDLDPQEPIANGGSNHLPQPTPF